MNKLLDFAYGLLAGAIGIIAMIALYRATAVRPAPIMASDAEIAAEVRSLPAVTLYHEVVSRECR